MFISFFPTRIPIFLANLIYSSGMPQYNQSLIKWKTGQERACCYGPEGGTHERQMAMVIYKLVWGLHCKTFSVVCHTGTNYCFCASFGISFLHLFTSISPVYACGFSLNRIFCYLLQAMCFILIEQLANNIMRSHGCFHNVYKIILYCWSYTHTHIYIYIVCHASSICRNAICHICMVDFWLATIIRHPPLITQWSIWLTAVLITDKRDANSIRNG